MKSALQPASITRALVASAALSLLAGAALAKDVKVNLTGAEETPPVTTVATGAGKISIAKDHTVKGEIKQPASTVSPLTFTSAHLDRAGRQSSP
jgi:hypothetical protein